MGQIEKSTRATETRARLDRIERSAADLPSVIPGRQFALLYAVLVTRRVPEEILAPSFCLTLGLLLPMVREPSSARVAQAARVVATYSYALSLVHGDLMWIAVTHGATWPAALRGVVFSVALVLLAFLAHHVIERPGMRLGVALERWAGREAASE